MICNILYIVLLDVSHVLVLSIGDILREVNLFSIPQSIELLNRRYSHYNYLNKRGSFLFFFRLTWSFWRSTVAWFRSFLQFPQLLQLSLQFSVLGLDLVVAGPGDAEVLLHQRVSSGQPLHLGLKTGHRRAGNNILLLFYSSKYWHFSYVNKTSWNFLCKSFQIELKMRRYISNKTNNSLSPVSSHSMFLSNLLACTIAHCKCRLWFVKCFLLIRSQKMHKINILAVFNAHKKTK